ncbi:hypothetical protein AYO20_07207 [Fonsecaea nubica]|uniref:Major facilitator superfamily (MFS) profile domain-containing protein n=1 Tax=Fonsecaea nubica TaxID=856822 RepID=A0A178CX63_9EURO|nr:hypothetical protein AYO20_07207 [Fonsecaea nubica]OAL33521.1 hypothetical protein AYO20_07207 [Fonsecaea nubica]
MQFVSEDTFTKKISVGTTAFAINGEIPRNRLRAKTNALVNLVNALVSFGLSWAIPELFQPDGTDLGLKMGYLFGGAALILFLLRFFTIPETAIRTSWQLDGVFESRLSSRKFKQAQFDTHGNLILSRMGRVDAGD